MLHTQFSGYRLFFGDLHNHCHQVGYGYGSIADALKNAREQLDFATVTAHSSWHDLAEDEERLQDIVRYSREGFARALAGWDTLVDLCEQWNTPGQFVTFPSFEWHSSRFGDRVIVYKGPGGQILEAGTPSGLAARIREYQKTGVEALIIPHHIGYPRGYRGLDWESFSEELSPVVEMISMHGAAESLETPRPYLHTMGPLDFESTAQAGLAAGHRFGLVGSTDHHCAYPGSYGSGRMGVWAEDLSRDSLWNAIKARRVYALTGDPLSLKFSANQSMMGGTVYGAPVREIKYSVTAGGAIDYVELLYCGKVIDRKSVLPPSEPDLSAPIKLELELGWGKKHQYVDWDCELEITGGRLMDVTPHFCGPDILSPMSPAPDQPLDSHWEWTGENRIRFRTTTWGNPTLTTPATQGLCLHFTAGEDTQLLACLNGKHVSLNLEEILVGGQSGFLGGFISPAYRFHRAVSVQEYAITHQINDRRDSMENGWYSLRVKEKNDQWAWSSPIWFRGSAEG